MGDLKACPFCQDGGNPKLFEHVMSTHPFVVICAERDGKETCQAQLWPSKTAEEAIAAWNTRATDTENTRLRVLLARARDICLMSHAYPISDFYFSKTISIAKDIDAELKVK